MKTSSDDIRRPRRRQVAQVVASERDLCDVDLVHAGAVKAALAALPEDGAVVHAAEVFGLLGNTTRLMILLALHSGRAKRTTELCVCDLAVIAHASPSMISHQLRLLRTSGLVRQRRAGKLMYYRLADGPLSLLLNGVRPFTRQENGASAPGPRAGQIRPQD